MVFVFTCQLVYELSWVGLVAPITILVLVVFQLQLNKAMYTINKKRFELSDQRGKKVSEIVNGIKMIKFNAWENIMIDQVGDIREKESTQLVKFFLIKSFATGIGVLSSSLSGLIVFYLYTQFVGELDLPKVYMILSILNNLVHPIVLLQRALERYLATKVSSERFSLLGKISQDGNKDSDHSDVGEEELKDLNCGDIQIQDGEFWWSDPEFDKKFDVDSAKIQKTKQSEVKSSKIKPVDSNGESNPALENRSSKFSALENINIEFKKGEFVAVVGKVGSGKTALILSLMDELVRKGGKVIHKGSFAYISQEAFLLNDTIRENITFGKGYDEEFYNKVLDICQLRADLKILPGGDMTQIGERGINLSGGQKQRISIARAVYSQADIYLIDDALSAVDAHVGKKLLDLVFKGELGGKTRIMVTNMVKHLNSVSRVVLIDKKTIVQDGLFEDVKTTKDFKEFNEEQETIRNRRFSVTSLAYIPKEKEGDDYEEIKSDEEEPSESDSTEKEKTTDDEFEEIKSDEEEPSDSDNTEKEKTKENENNLEKERKTLMKNNKEVDLGSVQAEKPKNKSIEKQKDRSTEKHSTEKPKDQSIEKQKDRSTEKPKDHSTEKQKKHHPEDTNSIVKRKEVGKLNKKDLRAKAQISSAIYLFYVRSAGWIFTIITLLLFTLAIAAKTMGDLWVGRWAEKSYDLTNNEYFLIYLGIIISVVILFFIRSFFYGIVPQGPATTCSKR